VKLRSVAELAPLGKKVVVRVDWNVTLGKALQVVDDTRIKRTKLTIEYLLKGEAEKVVLVSHLGKAEEKRSIEPVAKYAAKILGREIKFCRTIADAKEVRVGLVILENVRWWPGEDKNEPEFVSELASLGEVFVNEAFGECHRETASIVGIPRLLDSYAGFNLIEEVENITRVVNNPKRPLVVVIGGSKVEDKCKLLEVISRKADVLLLGGKLANQFAEKKMKLSGKARVILPIEGSKLLDIGRETQELFSQEISQAQTVVWNGPMGKIEEPQYREGTHAVYEALVKNEPAEVLVGGGDTLSAIRDEKHLERIDWISTGGGAMLKLIEKGDLVGLGVLQSHHEIGGI